MEQILNEQTTPKTHTVATEDGKGEDKGAVSLGKFKDASALLTAYNALQSEFTKRCQKIKQLESQLETNKQAENSEEVTLKQEEIKEPIKMQEAQLSKEDALKDYLLEVIGKKPKAIVMDGAGASVKTPVYRPTTIEEAGKLAKNIFNK